MSVTAASSKTKAVRRCRLDSAIELHIPSQLGWERAAMDLAGSVARRLGFRTDRVEDLKTAVSEATINAIEHGNGQNAARRVLIAFVPEEDKLNICVKDESSKPFGHPGTSTATPQLEDTLRGLATARGWGMFLIRSLVDEVEFSSTKRGNVVRMVLHLEPAA